MFSTLQIKNFIAKKIVEGLNREFELKVSEKELLKKFEYPNKIEFGDLAFPLFEFAKSLKMSPDKIFTRLSKYLMPDNTETNYIENIEFKSGYINFKFNVSTIIRLIINSISVNDKIEFEQFFKDYKVVLDYSSPNIAKPFAIGHLISTAIGESIKRIYRALGAKAIGINFIGDWGTQFGKVIAAFKLWGDEKSLEKEGVEYLYKLYVKYHKEEEKNKELEKLAKEYFKKLESNDPEIKSLWKKFRDISLREFSELYKLLNVEFDFIEGESRYAGEKAEQIIEILKYNNLLEESDNAFVVNVSSVYNEDLPPCIIKKSDGTTIYATRDLAAILDRWERFRFDKLLYITGITQSLHFKQIFGVIKRTSFVFKDNLIHIPFGTMLFSGEKMGTRKGNIIFLKDLYKLIYEKALEITKLKNISSNPEKTARLLAIGALNFSILKNSRIKDIDFNFKKVLEFEGDTSVYIQYTLSRINSVISKSNNNITFSIIDEKLIQLLTKLLITYRNLFLIILKFEDIVLNSAYLYEPYLISRYALTLCSEFNKFYSKEKILEKDEMNRMSKLILLKIIKMILEKSLELLNIPEIEKL